MILNLKKAVGFILLSACSLLLTAQAAFADTAEYTYNAQNNTVYKITDGGKSAVNDAEMIFVDAAGGEDSNNGSYAMPLKSIAYAVQRSAGIKKDTFIILKPAKYTVDKTINIYPEYAADKKLVIMSYDGGATISGERILGGEISLYDEKNNIYVLRTESGLSFRQLYANGKRAVRAKQKIPEDFVLNDDGYETADVIFGNLQNPAEIEFVYEISWMNPRCGVEGISSDGSKYFVKMNKSVWEKGNSFMRGKYPLNCVNAPVSMENAYEFIDEAGEWYYNRTTGELFYKAFEGEDVYSDVFAVSQTETLMSINGSANLPCANVEIHNIAFENTKWEYVTESGGFLDTQASCIYMNGAWYKYLPAALNIESGKAVTVNNCSFSRLGANAIRIIGASKDITISNNKISDASGSGIVAGNVRAYGDYFILPHSDKYSTKNIAIRNNEIYGIGAEYGGSVAIQTGYVDTLSVSNNTIHDVPYTAIHVGWGWQANETSAIKNTVVSSNYIYNFMMNYNDGAAIYTLGSTGASKDNMNVITGNYIKSGTDTLGNYKNGIYLDQGSNFWEVYGNVVEAEAAYENYYWLLVNTWKYNYIHSNFTNFASYNLPYRSYPTFEVAFNQATVTDGVWGEEAKEIMNNAGISK